MGQMGWSAVIEDDLAMPAEEVALGVEEDANGRPEWGARIGRRS
jgi:hypothetical protein